jgi:hypothetical protein
LVVGPDVWELVVFLREIDERGPAAVNAAGETFAVSEQAVEAGIAYWTAHPEEIEAWITAAEHASVAAEQEWERRRTLLA